MRPPRTVTVLIDSRENYPLLFPQRLRLWVAGKPRLVRVKTEKRTLKTGDYLLAARPNGCVIERKGSISEIARNLLDPKDKSRASAAFSRLAKCELPVLLLDMTPSDMYRPSRHLQNPEPVIDALWQLASRLKLMVVWGGYCKPPEQRRLLGNNLLRMMLWHMLNVRQKTTRRA